jgi:signal transduction histidine kinase/GAF domain-containing protein
LRTRIFEQLQRNDVEVSREELTLLSDWVWAADYERLHTANVHATDLLDQCPDLVVIVSLDGRIRYANRTAMTVINEGTGLSPEQIIGRLGRDLGLWVQAGPSATEFQELARAKSVVEVLLAGRWYELRVRELVGNDGTVDQLGLALTDIHKHKYAQLRLGLLSKLSRLVGTVERDDLWKALAPMLVPAFADWCAVSAIENGQMQDITIAHRDPSKADVRRALERAACALKHHPLWLEMLPTGLQLLHEVSDELLRKLSGSDEYYQLISQVGVRSLIVVPVVSRGHPVAIITLAYTDESGRRYAEDDPAVALEIALHAAHLSENSRLAAETRTNELRFHVALAHARTNVFEQDASLRYVWCYGPDIPGSFIGKTDDEVLPADVADEVTSLKKQVLATGKPIAKELELRLAGQRRYFRATFEAVRDRTGRPIGVIGASTELTEQKETQQRLSLAVDLRERVMGVLSHDLRNPLSAITMAADALCRRDGLPPDVAKSVAVVDRAALRMKAMISALLDVVRLRGSQQPLPVERSDVDLGKVVGDIVEESRAAWPDRNIELTATGTTRALADGPRIGEALSNLLSNAITYGARGRPINVSLEGDHEWLTLRVHNFGNPIPASLRPVLFEPFTRGQPDGSAQGLGLGLYVAKEIVASHSGTLAVESSADAGTTFTIRIPRAVESSDDAEAR